MHGVRILVGVLLLAASPVAANDLVGAPQTTSVAARAAPAVSMHDVGFSVDDDSADKPHDANAPLTPGAIARGVGAGALASIAGFGAAVVVNGVLLFTPLSWGLLFAGAALIALPFVVLPAAVVASGLLVGPSSVLVASLLGGKPAAVGAFAGMATGAVVGCLVGYGVFWGAYGLEMWMTSSRPTRNPGDESAAGIVPAIAFWWTTQTSAAVGAGVGAAIGHLWFADDDEHE